MNAHPPPRFVTQGVYRLVSHPVYAGFFVLCIGVAIAWDRNTWNLTTSAAMPNPGLCRIEFETSAFGVEWAH